jgi:hypothetical protein
MASWKDEVRAATVANLPALKDSPKVDEVQLVPGDRLLVKNQSDSRQNGIYKVVQGPWSLDSDFNTSALVTPESVVRVSEGTVNAHTEWIMVTQAPINLGTTPLTFASGSTCTLAHLYGGGDAAAKIIAAIESLPLTGGCVDARGLTGSQTLGETITIDRPVTLLLGAGQFCAAVIDPLFKITAGTFTIIGLDPKATTISAGAHCKARFFSMSGDFFDPDGSATIVVQRIGFHGSGSAPALLETGSYPGTNFQDGLMLLEDNLIQGFSDIAVKVGASVYYIRIHRNAFISNKQAIYLDNNTEASIRENYFAQAKGGGPSLTLVGPMHRIVHNYFTRHCIADTANSPDILLFPQKAWSGMSGGDLWIEDNRFMSEHENFDRARCRIKLSGDKDIPGGSCVIRGNFFLANAPKIAAATGDGTSATITLTADYSTQGLQVGDSVTISRIAGVSVADYNGTFNVTSVFPPTQFTYKVKATLPSDASGGTVTDTTGNVQPIAVATGSGITATITLAAGSSTQSLKEGDNVTISGVSVSEYNGTFSVKRVFPPTQFSYSLPYTPLPTTPSNIIDAVVQQTKGMAISLENPHMPWEISGNLFANYGILVSDCEQTLGAPGGQSTFFDNRIVSPVPGYRVFRNEGREYTASRLSADASIISWDPAPRRNESRLLRNRVCRSEALDTWTTHNTPPSQKMAVRADGPQDPPDPFNTKRAFKVVLGGGPKATQAISTTIVTGGLWQAPGGPRLVLKLWARQGSLSTLTFGVFDQTQNQFFGNLFTVSLGSDWKQYKFITNGLHSVTDQYLFMIYPGDTHANHGDVYVFAPQASEDESDYLPNPCLSRIVEDLHAGNRFEKSLNITSLTTSTHAGSQETGPAIAGSTGGSASVENGSTDCAGIIVLAPVAGQTSGTVTVKYNQGYQPPTAQPPTAPVVVAGLEDAGPTTPWNASAQVRVASSSPGCFVLAWSNGGSAPPANAKITYFVIGRSYCHKRE